MNKLKLYLRTEGNINEQANVYASVFHGKVLKHSFLNINDTKQNTPQAKNIDLNFAYLEILSDINILIALHSEAMPQWGYSQDNVLYLESLELFNTIYNNLRESEYFGIEYDVTKYSWGTQIVKFKDKWNFYWILECKY